MSKVVNVKGGDTTAIPPLGKQATDKSAWKRAAQDIRSMLPQISIFIREAGNNPATDGIASHKMTRAANCIPCSIINSFIMT